VKRATSVLRGFESLATTQHVFAALDQRSHRSIGGLWGASTGLLIHALQRHWKGAILVITADDDDSLALGADIDSFRPERAKEAPPRCLVTELYDIDGQIDQVSRSQRVRVLGELQKDDRFLLIGSVDALTQPAPSRRNLGRGRVELKVGSKFDPEELLIKATTAGLRDVPLVLAPGEISRRGDILDVYPMASPDAFRLEFFDDELESIRKFDPTSQRSLEVCKQILLALGVTADEECAPLTCFDLASLPTHDLDFKILSAGSAVGSGETDPMGRLRSIRGLKGSIRIVCGTQADGDRLRQIFANKGVALDAEQISIGIGTLSRGFRIPDAAVTIVSNTEFAGVPSKPRTVEKMAVPSRALQSFFELGPGDVVVHAVHGLARFEEIELVKRGFTAEDHLRLLFRDEVRLLVPVSKIHLVQKYVGAGDGKPRLDKLGGKSFAKRKEEVAQSLFDMASDLLDLSVERQTSERPPYPRDPLEDEFLDGFPFTDTPDQVTSWEEIRADLEKPAPMDRLLCGDVGFGKTELAMRAAFKVAITGRQVAVLVPTTILAEQHAQTFAERFTPHALVVEVLSRFRTAKARKAVIAALAAGRVDVLVGTHRLLSEDVHFRQLGLLVVDEEQRFGVRHKEHIKSLKRTVDVLTLSATPIPRTMHASLVGIRDISTLTQPPEGRQEVDTRMAFQDPVIVQQTIQRELAREGQVYYLHNRVESIERVATDIRKLAPNATVVVGHGKMTESQMEKALRTFLRGEADILVCTTIIENGLDIPRANTMLIERADRFGLAELHQLRGRVGRSSARAHCLLLLDRTMPIGEEAKKRLKAIEEFSSLGAGFAIAMKDLEIRGAGNLLGPQQSGHIAAVGYEMYCQLLKVAMDGARQNPDATEYQHYEVREVDVDLRLSAFLPDTFVTEPKARLDLLREMDAAQTPDAAVAIGLSIMDRFGSLPEPVETLLLVFLLKHLLLGHGVLGVQFVDSDRVVVRHPPGHPLGGAWLDSFDAVRQVEPGKTHLILPRRCRGHTEIAGPGVLQLFLQALLGENRLPMMRKEWSGKQRRRRKDSTSAST
jgi:transcription-repair coupling factor (superfamily II helicase)